MRREIKGIVESLCTTNGTDSPFELCERLGIETVSAELPECTKGFCLMLSAGSAIVLNNRLRPRERRAVLAHELGHAVLHEGCNYMFMSANTGFVTGKYEKEADLFAAHLLLRTVDETDAQTFCNLSQSLCLPQWAVEEAFKLNEAENSSYFA